MKEFLEMIAKLRALLPDCEVETVEGPNGYGFSVLDKGEPVKFMYSKGGRVSLHLSLCGWSLHNEDMRKRCHAIWDAALSALWAWGYVPEWEVSESSVFCALVEYIGGVRHFRQFGECGRLIVCREEAGAPWRFMTTAQYLQARASLLKGGANEA